jgi:hypothetical protein
VVGFALAYGIFGGSDDNDEEPILSERDLPRANDVISLIKRTGRIDFRQVFPSDWEAICFSGEYERPVENVRDLLGKNFPTCSGRFAEDRVQHLRAMTIVWPDRCRVIDVRDFRVFGFRSDRECIRREDMRTFVLTRTYGPTLSPSEQ